MKITTTIKCFAKFSLVVLLLFLAGFSYAMPIVVRGPYLQLGTPTSITISWRSDIATNSRVNYGDAINNLTASVNDANITTEHTVTISGLQSNTKYYYSVGTDSDILAGNDEQHFFVTSPTAGTEKPVRIWVLGDSGTAGDPNHAGKAQAVADAYLTNTGNTHTDLWLMLGDNAYPDGTDSEYQTAVFDVYTEILNKSVLWSTIGNHDGLSADSATQTGPYYDIFTLPKAAEAGGIPSGTEAYYSFDYANIHFVCLDSNESDRSRNGPMLTWLEQDLAATTQEWIIAFWHHPPYTKGSHDSDLEIQHIEMRENALPILEQAGVDLVLGGHSHDYERSYLIHNHYGTSDTFLNSMKIDAGDGRVDGNGAYEATLDVNSPKKGTVYVVAGSSGSTGGGILNHPAMFISLNELGSLALDIEGPRLDATFIDDKGQPMDYFTIVKPSVCSHDENQNLIDTDGDNINDICDLDDDNDGLLDSLESTIGSHPQLADTDGDGLTDYDEINYDGDPSQYTYGEDLNPLTIDTDKMVYQTHLTPCYGTS